MPSADRPRFIQFGDLFVPQPNGYNSNIEYVTLATLNRGMFNTSSIRRTESGIVMVGTMGTGDWRIVDRITGRLTVEEIVQALRRSETYNNPIFQEALDSMIEFVSAESTKPPLRLVQLKHHQ